MYISTYIRNELLLDLFNINFVCCYGECTPLLLWIYLNVIGDIPHCYWGYTPLLLGIYLNVIGDIPHCYWGYTPLLLGIYLIVIGDSSI